MAHSSIPVLSQFLRRLTARYGDSSTDHELLQRFVAHREEPAFAALLERHAPMVLGLCRSILRNHHDAEDIFQAVFLVLARKAGSIRKGDSLGSWLYAIAYRLAHKARVRAERQSKCEQKAALPSEQTPMDEVTWGELREALHEEVSRLPEKYRAAVVLCYWQGRTHEQAGQQLGCARGTIKDRLEKAREMLRTRLARRGLALPAVWFAASLSEGTSAAISLELAHTTVRGAMLFSLGQMPHGVVSAKAVACAQSALQAMLVSKLKYGLVLLLMLGVLGGSIGLAALRETAIPANEPEAPATANEPEASATDDPLPAGAVARLGTLRFRHSESIGGIAVGPDGSSIFSSTRSAVYVWDLATGKERKRLANDKKGISSFAISRDGKVLATGSYDGTIHLWDTDTGKELLPFTAHPGEAAKGWIGPAGAYASYFTPDGRQIVSMGSDNTVRLWDTKTGKKNREFGPFHDLGSGASLSPDGKTLACVIKDDKTTELRLWDVATGRERKRWQQPGKRILWSGFSPDSKMLAIVVGEDDYLKPSEIQLWDANFEKKIHTLQGHKGWTSYSFASDGKTLVSWCNSHGETAWLWDVSTGKKIGRIGGDQFLCNQLLFCPDGRTLVSYTQCEHGLQFWDRASGKETRSSGESSDPIDILRFSPDGRALATGSYGDWAIRLWDIASRKRTCRMEHGALTALQFSPDGKQLASSAWTEGEVRIWDTAGGKELRRIASNQNDKSVNGMAWSGDGKMLATWNRKERLIRLWNADTGKQLRELSTGVDEVEALVFSPNSKVLAAKGSDYPRRWDTNLILLWEADTGRLLHSLDMRNDSPSNSSNNPSLPIFSPDGRTLAVGGQKANASISVWELATGRLRLKLNQGEDVTRLAFSPDGKLLAAANANTAFRNYSLRPESLGITMPLPHIHVWDLAAEKEIHVLKGHQGPISSLAFSPDGKLLASGSDDTTVLLWDATRFKISRAAEVQVRAEQMESLWADLNDEDAAKAYRAIRTLAASPKSSVALLKRHLHPVAAVDVKQVTRLLADLDSEQFALREKAMKQLEKLGDRAATELHKALDAKPTLEVKRRIEQLLEKQNKPDRVRMIRALETLEQIGTAEARDLCTALADGVPDAPLTREARATLRRMVR